MLPYRGLGRAPGPKYAVAQGSSAWKHFAAEAAEAAKTRYMDIKSLILSTLSSIFRPQPLIHPFRAGSICVPTDSCEVNANCFNLPRKRRFSGGRAGRRFAPPSAVAALRAAMMGRLRHPRGAAPQVRTPAPEVWSPVSQVPGGSSKTSNPNTKNLKGSQSDPWKDWAWGTWFSQALAGQVVGVRTLSAAPRGFGPKGRKRGPAEGGRGEVNLPRRKV